jgi:hypothetical protein
MPETSISVLDCLSAVPDRRAASGKTSSLGHDSHALCPWPCRAAAGPSSPSPL